MGAAEHGAGSWERLADAYEIILDALPAQIALLDGQGTIVSVNEPWRTFDGEFALVSKNIAIGQNYLAICNAAQNGNADEARQVANGVRAVLNQEVDGFDLEYCCDSPTEQRWFHLNVLPLSGRRRDGVIVNHTNITDRKLPELALRKEHEKLVAAQAVAKIGSWETDLATLAITWSAETFRIFETSRKEFVPTHERFLTFVHPDDRASVSEAFVRSSGTREVCAIQHRLLMADGRIKVVVERWQTYLDQTGKPVRAVGTCQDITERHASDMKLQETEARYQMLFDATPFPTVVVDRDTRRFLAVNQATIDRYGWSRAEFMAKSSDELYPAADLAVAIAARLKFAPGTMHSIPGLHHRLKDGSIIDVDQTVHLIEFGGHPAVLATGYDVTARNRAMNELRVSEEKYRALVDTLPVGVLETTADGLIVTANRTTRRMFGFGDTENLAAVEIQELCADSLDRAAVLLHPVTGNEGSDVELVFRRRDGTLFSTECHLRSILDADGKIIGLRGIVIDITSRRVLENQLNQAQKMEALGQLTGGIAHDFNNILMIILANADALQEEHKLAPEALERIEQIGKATQRATDLTRSLLAFSHKLPLRPQRTDINDLVVATGKLLRRTLGAQIEIESVLGDDLCPVQVDRGQLENALVNLCVNARDAMPSGGRLLIETRAHTPDEASIADDLELTAGAYGILSVTDAGTGIPPETLARVFEPFFTTKEVGKGTGLGLSMVHGFIKQSKGHIRIKSVVGYGTTITMYLPCCEAVHVEMDKPIAGAMPRGREEILVVEDEARVRDVVVRQLQSLGYAVTSAIDGAAGLAAFEASARPLDLVLTDVVMPGPLNGKALADEVARRWPETHILFMSGYAEDVLVHDGRLEPGIALLSKPFRKIDLAQAVRRALDGQGPAIERPKAD